MFLQLGIFRGATQKDNVTGDKIPAPGAGTVSCVSPRGK